MQHLKKGFVLKVIDDKETKEIPIQEDTKELRLTEATENRKFIRLEVWDTASVVTVQGIEGNLLLITNPIYIQ